MWPFTRKAGDPAPEEQKADSVSGSLIQRFFLGTGGAPGTSDHPAAYEKTTWVFACVQTISEAVASVPLKWRDAEGEEVDSGPLPELFSYVNDDQDAGMFWGDTIADRHLHGNALWKLERGTQKKACPIAMFPLLPYDVETYAPRGQMEGFRHRRDGQPDEVLAVENVLHFRQYDPKHKFWGMSSLEPLETAINADRQAELANYNSLLHGIITAGVLWVKGKLNPKQKRAAQQRLSAEYAGTKNAGKTLVLDDMENLKFEQMGMSHKDAQFLELRRENRNQILAVFGVPRILLGLTDGVNYANAHVQRKLFWSDTVKPTLRKLAATLNENLWKFGPEAEGLTAEFDLSGVEALQPDYKLLAETGAILLQSGQWTNDEVRERLYEMEPKENGDADDEGRGGVRLAKAGGEADEEAEARGEEEAVKALPFVLETKAGGDGFEERKALWTRRQEEREPDVRALSKIVARVWGVFTEEVVANLGSEEEKGLKATVPSPGAVLFDLNEAGGLAVIEMTAAELAAYERAGNATVDLFNLSVPFEAATVGGEEWAAETAKRIRTLPETYHDEIRGVIGRAYEEGQPLSEVRYAVEGFYKEQYGDWNTPGAQRIAITEANGAASNATVEAYKQNGIERIRWLHSHAPLEPRPTHLAMDGQEREFGKTFATRPTALRYPHDPRGTAADNIWCRCDTAPVVD